MPDPKAAYDAQVNAILAAKPRNSSFVPQNAVELVITNRRAPKALAEMSPIERDQFVRMFKDRDPESLDRLLQFGDEEEDMPLDVEVAEVRDGEGVVRYRLWAWNYGAVYLMAADRIDCVAFTSQHNLEHWSPDQRDLFWAMDRALAQKGHGVTQPMEFCWWDDAHWDAIAAKPPGTAYSHPYIRDWFATG